MTTTYKCDFCGDIINFYSNMYDLRVEVNPNNRSKPTIQIASRDLCPQCMKMLPDVQEAIERFNPQQGESNESDV